jgi:hypothetical protein
MQGGIGAASGSLYPLGYGEELPLQGLSTFIEQQSNILEYSSVFSQDILEDPDWESPGSNVPLGALFDFFPKANMFPEVLTGSWEVGST